MFLMGEKEGKRGGKEAKGGDRKAERKWTGRDGERIKVNV